MRSYTAIFKLFSCSLDYLSELNKHRIPPIITITEVGKGIGIIGRIIYIIA